MRPLLVLVSTIAMSFPAFAQRSSGEESSGSGVPLAFFVLKDKKIEGGQFIDTVQFPKLGHIGSAADLMVTRLEMVVPDVREDREIMVDTNGKQTALPLQKRRILRIRMNPDDAQRFSELTRQSVGKRIVIMLGSTPLIAPMIMAPISTRELVLTLGEKADSKMIESELMRLTRK